MIAKSMSRGFVIATILLLGGPGLHAASKKTANAEGKKPKELVWPLPPERPRIRFVQEIHGATDISPLHRTTSLERLSGVRKVEFKPYFQKPFGVAVDSKGRIFVTDNAQAIVFVMDPEKHDVSYIGMSGAPKLGTPMGIHVDAKDRIWLADAAAKKVYAFDPELNLRAALGKDEELKNPVAVATDLTRSRVYVVDSQQHCVAVYDSETGLLVTKFGSRGNEDGQFLYPTDVSVGIDGRIYVTDAMNRRVQIFDSEYKLVDKLGSDGIRWGQFRKPKSIALDDYQNLYVVDSDFSNFQIFDQKKRLLMFLGAYGEGPGEFSVPQQIRIDTHNNIYVVDQMNQRLQIFKLLSGAPDEPAPAASR